MESRAQKKIVGKTCPVCNVTRGVAEKRAGHHECDVAIRIKEIAPSIDMYLKKARVYIPEVRFFIVKIRYLKKKEDIIATGIMFYDAIARHGTAGAMVIKDFTTSRALVGRLTFFSRLLNRRRGCQWRKAIISP